MEKGIKGNALFSFLSSGINRKCIINKYFVDSISKKLYSLIAMKMGICP